MPHGTVSYHFQGKHELLTEAALHTIEQLFPLDELKAVESLEHLILLIQTEVGNRDSITSVGTGVLLEAMRESARNPALRQRLAALLRDYRQIVAELVRSWQRQNTDGRPEPSPSALATLIAAVGDGLLLHVLLDPELDVGEATSALLTLLRW